jgi:hypothetical protein
VDGGVFGTRGGTYTPPGEVWAAVPAPTVPAWGAVVGCALRLAGLALTVAVVAVTVVKLAGADAACWLACDPPEEPQAATARQPTISPSTRVAVSVRRNLVAVERPQ